MKSIGRVLMNKIKLNVLGISYSQTQTGAYALVLTEEQGERRIPIIIGGFEAQSIAIQLEGLKPPRPLTHDLFHNFAVTFKIDLKEVIIYKLEEGVFYAKLICNNGGEDITIDARTSDAIALALRFKCPIFTTEEILSKSGIVIDLEQDEQTSEKEGKGEKKQKRKAPSEQYKNMSLEELQDLLEEAVNNEEYEKASIIRDEINRRENE